MFNSTSHRQFLICVASAVLLTACGGDNSAAPNTNAASSSATSAPAAVQQIAQDVSPLERGAQLYKRCQSCHTLEQDGRHKVGPNMWALYGSTAGTKEGFAYSKAMSESGVIWNDETLSAYIENPRQYMPGNRMSYAGLRKAEDREAVLAYIKSETTPK